MTSAINRDARTIPAPSLLALSRQGMQTEISNAVDKAVSTIFFEVVSATKSYQIDPLFTATIRLAGIRPLPPISG